MSKRYLVLGSGLAGVSALCFFRPFFEAAVQLGVNATEMTTELDLVPFELLDPESRLPIETMVCLWTAVSDFVGLPAFHLQAASEIPLGTFDVCEALMRSASRVTDQVEALQTYGQLLFDYPVETVSDGESVRVVMAAPAPVLLAEAVFARLMFVIRQTTGMRHRPLEVRLQGEPSPHAAELRQVFDAPIQFRHPANELVLDRALLEQQTLTGEPELARILQRVAVQAIERLPGLDLLNKRVRQAILKCLPDADPSVNRVASQLAMSPRTLQRKLSKEGTSYQQVLDNVRLERSIEYLARSRMPIAEAATLVGFADLTSFHRAFKRWMGKPPAEFRRESQEKTAFLNGRREPDGGAR
jgi:AraC-like DNA-binding protein